MRKTSSKLLNTFYRDFPAEEVDKLRDQIKEKMKDDGDLGRVEIIVLKYKNPEIEKECVQRIIDHTSHPYKLTLFDNRPNTGNTSKAWNKLIREATCNLVLIMDSDAFVNPDWLEPLVDCMTKHQDCILAVPVIENTAGGAVQQRKPSFEEPFVTKDHTSGFCFLTRKDYIKNIGWYDEDFYIFGQDSDMCERVMAHDFYKQYVVPKSLVHHGYIETPETSFSMSTRKAYEEGEFNWALDTQYAPNLVNLNRIKYQK